jgi:periplasmic copper chaperone A
MKHLIPVLLLSFAVIQPTHAQVAVKDPWVRATVPQQKATGAFMQLNAAKGGRLVEARSPAAGVVEIHQMSMHGGVMKMRSVAELDLPAGKAVELNAGGYHIMLMDLKQQIRKGDAIPITLIIESKDGKRENVQISAVVRSLGDMQKH